MCRVDPDSSDAPTVYRETKPRARKEHHCVECGRTIAVGEIYLNAFMIFYGDASTYHTCEHCAVGARWLMRNCGGYNFGEVAEEIDEHAVDYPMIAAPLRAISAGAERQWRHLSGAMMALQEMPPSIEDAINA